MTWRGQTTLPRHAWWHGQADTVAATGDVAQLCRATDHGVAGLPRTDAPSRTAWQDPVKARAAALSLSIPFFPFHAPFARARRRQPLVAPSLVGPLPTFSEAPPRPCQGNEAPRPQWWIE